jgi:putative endonuclease
MFWVYLLKCADQSYYTGHTDNLENRLTQHHHRDIPGCFTATRLPVQLVFTQEFATRVEALASERQIKGWSRKKKEAFIKGNWEALSAYAQRKKKL